MAGAMMNYVLKKGVERVTTGTESKHAASR